MSSIPLISHHLFVAAVSDKNSVRSLSGAIRPAPPAPQVPIREIPLELVDFGRPLPVEASWPAWTGQENDLA